MAELLITRGAKCDAEDKSGHTPLWWATENSRSPVVKLLLEHDGVTLHMLVQRGERTKIHLFLLSAGNINSRNSFNQTPLHIAVDTGQAEITAELLSHGADIDAEDDRGRTSLRLAIDQKKPTLIDLLLKNLANPQGITRNKWLDAYQMPGIVTMWLTEGHPEVPPIRFLTDREIPEHLPLWGPQRNIL